MEAFKCPRCGALEVDGGAAGWYCPEVGCRPELEKPPLLVSMPGQAPVQVSEDMRPTMEAVLARIAELERENKDLLNAFPEYGKTGNELREERERTKQAEERFLAVVRELECEPTVEDAVKTVALLEERKTKAELEILLAWQTLGDEKPRDPADASLAYAVSVAFKTRDNALKQRDEAQADRAQLHSEIERLKGGMEAAWGVIANAGGGDWDTQGPVWKEAAARWRDEHWHPSLDRASTAPNVISSAYEPGHRFGTCAPIERPESNLCTECLLELAVAMERGRLKKLVLEFAAGRMHKLWHRALEELLDQPPTHPVENWGPSPLEPLMHRQLLERSDRETGGRPDPATGGLRMKLPVKP